MKKLKNSVNLGISVPIDMKTKIHRMVEAVERDYPNILPDKECNKGIALFYLLTHGMNSHEMRLDAKDEQIKAAKKKLKGDTKG